MKCLLVTLLLGLSAASAAAEPSIGNVLVRQQWPWDDKVYIDYDVTGMDAAAPKDVVVTAYNGETLLGELPCASLGGTRYNITKDGRYRIVFDPSKGGDVVRGDLSKFNVALSLVNSTADSEILYKIVDLASGEVTDVSRAELLNGNYGAVEQSFEFVGTTSLQDVLIWTGVTNNIAYKTTHMVFRKIRPGTFTMGSPEGESNNRKDARETQHQVTLTKHFYMGVFKLTRAQWMLINKAPPVADSYTNNQKAKEAYEDTDKETYSATYMYYNILRGNYTTYPEEGGNWPTDGHRVSSSSFIGKLRAAATIDGYIVDLPTEAQWEYACRAGTEGISYNGKGSISGLIYDQKEIGRFKPNAFGLYDVLSNGGYGEVVLDYSAENYGSELGAAVTDPIGGTAEEANADWPRVVRGGYSRMAERTFTLAAYYNNANGCRLALHEDLQEIPPADENAIGSNVAGICFDTRTTPYWRTVFSPGDPGSVTLDWPKRATSATLTVTVGDVSSTHTITDRTATSYPLAAFALPAEAADERVCTLTLAYDSGVTNTASLGIVQGAGARRPVPLIRSAADGKWNRTYLKRCVLPIPAGTTQLTLNGVDVPVAVLGGDAGWAAWTLDKGDSTLVRHSDGGEQTVVITQFPAGTLIIVR